MGRLSLHTTGNVFRGEDMITSSRSRRAAFQAGYFDRFWGCPGCFRTLSIAEIIELYSEDIGAAFEPMEMVEGKCAMQEMLP